MSFHRISNRIPILSNTRTRFLIPKLCTGLRLQSGRPSTEESFIRNTSMSRTIGTAGTRHPIDGRWYHGNWHGNWDNAWHSGWHDWWANPWYARPAFWGVTGWLLGAAVYDWGYLPYYNPYYTQPLTFGSTVVDYGQPVETVDYSDDPNGGTGPPVSEAAEQESDAARQAFYDQNYPLALSEIEKALAQMPGDPALHEFRALVLFALGRYQPAAAAVHSLLAVGPGWDWTTMISLYPSVDIYTKQLRELEIYRHDHPNAADARFLLAYHYLTMGHSQAAARELREVVHLVPQDRVASQLLLMITAPASQTGGAPNAASPEPEEPGTTPAGPAVDPASLVGTWTAHREEGSTIQLTITPDSKFNWRFSQGGRTQSFDGSSSVANNVLVLQRNDGQSMVGRIIPSPQGRGFRFLLVGGPPNDPGLDFVP